MSDSPGQGGVVIERGREQRKSVILEVPWALQATEAFDCLWDKTNASQQAEHAGRADFVLQPRARLSPHGLLCEQALCGLGS